MKKTLKLFIATWIICAFGAWAQYNGYTGNWSGRTPTPTTTLNNGAVVTLDIDDAVDTLYIANNANDADLIINQAKTLTVTTLHLGRSTGAGHVTQSAGTMNVGGTLAIAYNTSGNASVYNLSGGTLNARTVTANAGGSMNMSGGTWNASNITLNAGSKLNLSGGTITNSGRFGISGGGIVSVTSGVTRISTDAATTIFDVKDGTLFEVSGGTLTLDGALTLSDTSVFRVIGSQSTINVGRIQSNVPGAIGTYEFVFDADGITAIQASNLINLNNASIVVDGTKFTGAAGAFDLFITANYNLAVDTNNVTITGFDSYGGAYLNHDTATNTFQIIVIPEPATTGLFIISALGLIFSRRLRCN